MTRTRERPLVVGSLSPAVGVPIIALIMVIAPAVGVALWNPSLSIFLLLGAFIYLVIYTLWLKPRTLLNIIVGGAAGSAAVLSGSAAVGHWYHAGALTLALTLFLWTPTHFWSLAIIHREDYAAGGIPMLPVKTGSRAAAWWVLLHTLTTTFGALALGALPTFGWLYRFVTPLAAAALLWLNAGLILKPELDRAARLFKASNAFLGTILLLILLETIQ